MPHLLLIPAVLLALAFAPAPFPSRASDARASAADLKAMQGEWVCAHESTNGNESGSRADYTLSVTGRTFVERVGGRTRTVSTVSIDATKNPRHCDYANVDSGYSPGIYRLEGDTLTLCWANRRPFDRRPTGFGGGDGVCVMVFKRAKR